MLTNKVFMRKTKRGNIIKVAYEGIWLFFFLKLWRSFQIVREHYLRDDIWCGSKLCIVCAGNNSDFVLSECPTVKCSKFDFKHYLLVDTNVVLDQIDILEEETIKDVIVLYTVMDELKHKSPSVYKRFRDIVMNSSRRFYTFINEHHKDTFVKRLPGESANDRNDRAIRDAALWYERHLCLSKTENQENIRVILVTDDVSNRMKAVETGLISVSVEEYVRNLVEYPQLADKLSQKNCDFSGKEQNLYPAHWSNGQIHDGIKSKEVLQGSFFASRENYLEGFVKVDGRENSVSFFNAKNYFRITLKTLNLFTDSYSRSKCIESSNRWRHCRSESSSGR